MKTKTQKAFKFTRNIEIGSPDAETDRLLMKAFVENDALMSLIDMNNQKCIIIGRTGSGKSALIKYIEEKYDKVRRIEPEAMSLRFLSNSNILQYFNNLQINLNFFYKVLWKHVFIIELLKLYFGEDSFKKQNWFDEISDKIRRLSKKTNPRKEKAILYMTKWSNEFWSYTEKRIKEIEKSIEEKYINEVGLSNDFFSIRNNFDNKIDERILIEHKYKAEKVINECQAEELHEIISILKDEIFNDDNRRYYLIIDDLDKEWIPTSARYALIGAMIEVIKEFQILNGIKIIIAIRDNLYQMVFAGFKHNGGQREKFKPLYINLEWTEDELKVFIENRLKLISDNSINVKSAFAQLSKGENGFKYVLDRTFLRPRDVISFINHAIENANNKNYFTLGVIKKAELSYSTDRLIAIEDEWGENYGNINDITKFLIGKYNGFNLKNIKEDEFINVYFTEKIEEKYKGDLLNNIVKWKNGEIKFNLFIKEIIFILYTIGIIGVKKGPNYSVAFFYNKEIDFTVNDITMDCKIYVHKAFYAALKINTKELEENVY